VTDSDSIRGSVPARSEFVPVLRGLVSSVGARLDLPYEHIDELRMAVDEACALLLRLSSGDVLWLRLQPSGDSLIAEVGRDAAVSDWPPAGVEESWPWRVIAGLADEARCEVSDDGGPSIVIVKRVPSLR
jgi:serine/threonine-protein kinase RsbW